MEILQTDVWGSHVGGIHTVRMISQAERRAERLKDLRREIASDRYEVDAEAVADAIVSKLLLVRRGRGELTAAPALTAEPGGRIPAARRAARRPR
jgi:hypothetical protein